MKVVVPLPMPGSWERRRGKYLFKRIKRDPIADEGVVTAFRDGQVTLRSKRREDGFTNAELEIGYQGIRAGDLVIHGMDGFAGAIGVSDSDGKASPVVHAYLSMDGNDPRFFAYLLRDLAINGFITSLAKGIRERSTAFDSEMFKCLDLPLPPVSQQKAIADYLDRETARIDALIEKKQQELGLFSEFRTAYISRELSQIRNQSPVKLKYLFRIVGGGTPTTDPSNWGGQVQWATPVDLAKSNGDAIASTERTLTSEGLQSQSRLVGASSIIISTRAPIGYVAQCVVPMSFNQGCKGLEPKIELDTRFFLHQMSTLAETLNSLGQGSTFKELSSESLSQVQLKMTDIATQRTISKRIDEKMLLIARAIVSTTKQIELLTERRQALITAAVAGELDIPEAAA